MPLNVGDRVFVRKDRDAPAALADKTVPITKVDELSIWVEKDGQIFVLDRSQVRKQSNGHPAQAHHRAH